MNKRSKSTVSFRLTGGNLFLGQNPFIASLTGTGQRRICDNCENCNKMVGPTETVCSNEQTKTAFGIGENYTMPKVLHKYPVANFCNDFAMNTTVVMAQPYASTNTTDVTLPVDETVKPETKPAFVATKNGKYYYPAGYVFPKNIKLESLLHFANVEDAIHSGKVPKF